MDNFTPHLHVHSEYSVQDGLLSIKQLVKLAAERNMPAIALTDRNNMFAAIKFYESCIANGIKPLIGAEVSIRHANALRSENSRIVVLAKNTEGYENLIKIVSEIYLGDEHLGAVGEETIFRNKSGLIVLSGGLSGHLWDLLESGHTQKARELASRWKNEFGDSYYIEITRTGRPNEETFVKESIEIAVELDVPVVATNDVCFAQSADYEAHEARVCIQEGRTLNDSRRVRRYSEFQYVRSNEEMMDLFSDLPASIANAQQIAIRCSSELKLGTYHLPRYPVPEGSSLEQLLESEAERGLLERFANENITEHKQYQTRLSYELKVINQMGFAGYFLIVMEFIAWSRSREIPVGPGRGSGSGSLVAYALKITNLDPIRYGLLFERFLNPERVSMPDFDIDFCMDGRDEVIRHVSELYGSEAVSQIITFGTMAAKAVVRDVARVQGKPYSLADRVSKMIPFEVGMTLTKAMSENRELADFARHDADVSEIMEMAFKLEGVVRNVGRHAGGVVIAPTDLTDFVPVFVEEESASPVSQFDKDDVEKAGLVKFDFLGLKTLTIIKWAIDLINQDLGSDSIQPKVSLESIDISNSEIYERLREAKTVGIFQLESRGMKDLIRRLLPDSIEDIIALVALFRPGPLQSGAVDDYVDRKHGRAKIEYPHPLLEPVLKSTYGVVLYQEQVMQTAQVLAGFSLGQADLLRRAMGKKKPEEMAKVREQFLEGSSERDIPSDLANQIFDSLEKFAGYAFNKSHSATYALISVQTAWLKTFYPAHFLAANLSAEMQNTDRILTLVSEARELEIKVLMPSINESDFHFTVDDGDIRYGLGAIKGLGEAAIEMIVEARSQSSFESLREFCRRVEAKKLGRRALEALINSGSMDSFGLESGATNEIRSELHKELEAAIKSAEQIDRDAKAGIVDLFGGIESGTDLYTGSPTQALSVLETLEKERESLGLFLSGHPMDVYSEEICSLCPRPLDRIESGKKRQWIAGVASNIRFMQSKQGKPICFFTLSDSRAFIEASVPPECYEKCASTIRGGDILLVECEIQPDRFTNGLVARVQNVISIDEYREKFIHSIVIHVNEKCWGAGLVDALKANLDFEGVMQGRHRLSLLYDDGVQETTISLGENWNVDLSDDLLFSLRSAFGQDNVKLNYVNVKSN